jgi:6-phosphogluconolactonase/glucosamine-6-phosphate isomerase/deaminase
MLAKKSAEKLNEKLGLYPESDVLLLLSGGSSLALLEHIDISLINPRFTIAMSDDRYSKDPNINNFSLLAQTPFFAKAKHLGAHFIDTSIQNDESLTELAERFETAIRGWQKNHKGPIIATMGMGPDGHTCGMMPYPEDPELFEKLFESRNLVAGYDAGDKNEYPKRITITMPLVLQINHAVIYVQGKNKTESLQRVYAEDGSLAETPARIWRELNDAEIFTDIEL